MRNARLCLFFGVAMLYSSQVAAQSPLPEVIIVHGIPGADLSQPGDLRVDISVDGACAIRQLAYRGIVGPLHVAAGTRNIAVHYPATGNCTSAPVIGPAAVPFYTGETSTVIAHLGSDGRPTASKFVNDLRTTTAGRARVLIHHTANAPAVDAYLTRAFGNPLSTVSLTTGLVAGEQAVAPVPGDTQQLALTAAGSTAAALGPVGVSLSPNRAYLLYVVGSLTNRTLDVIVKDVSELK